MQLKTDKDWQKLKKTLIEKHAVVLLINGQKVRIQASIEEDGENLKVVIDPFINEKYLPQDLYLLIDSDNFGKFNKNKKYENEPVFQVMNLFYYLKTVPAIKKEKLQELELKYRKITLRAHGAYKKFKHFSGFPMFNIFMNQYRKNFPRIEWIKGNEGEKNTGNKLNGQTISLPAPGKQLPELAAIDGEVI